MGRTVKLGLLDAVEIASPCSADWERMAGDERSRFCADCRLNVYNLSAMTRAEAEALIVEKEGRLCGRFWRRADGTVLTRDCPVGLAKVRAKVVAGLARVAAAAAFLVGGTVTLGMGRSSAARLREMEPFATVCGWLSPRAPVLSPPGQIMMGAVACPPAPRAGQGGGAGGTP